MNAFVPCHSSTPKSLSKLSVMRVPRHLPVHSRLQALDVRLRRARGECEGGVARVQMGDVGDLVGHKGAAAAGVVGPAEHAGLEEGAIDDQLTAALEQVEQAHPAPRALERVVPLHRQPRHPPAPAAIASRARVSSFSSFLLFPVTPLIQSLSTVRSLKRQVAPLLEHSRGGSKSPQARDRLRLLPDQVAQLRRAAGNHTEQ